MGKHSGGGPRVLVVHPGAELYGSDRVLIDAVMGFIEREWDVLVLLPNDGPLRAVLEGAGAEVRMEPGLVLRKALMKPTGWPALVSGLVGGYRLATRLIREYRPDVVYVSTITQPLWAPVARRMGVPVVLHVHEAEASAHALVRKVLYWPALSADRIVTNSDFARSTMLESYAGLDARTRIVWNAVPGPDQPLPPRSDITDALRVVYVGRLSPRKGVDLIVEAIGSLVAAGRDVHLDVLGAAFEGYEWFDSELRERAVADGIEDRVHFLGFREDVWDVISAADVMIVPSRADEPFGNTAVEAVLALRPVIVSDTSGLREATAGISTAVPVRPGSAADIATALTTILDDWPTYAGRVEAAAQVARSRHDVSSFRHALNAEVAALL